MVSGQIGVSKMEQFRWRQMLDFYSCTECGRCQDVCPAYQSGLSLSPKMLMINLAIISRSMVPLKATEKSIVPEVITRRSALGLHHLLCLRSGMSVVYRTRYADRGHAPLSGGSRQDGSRCSRMPLPIWDATATHLDNRTGCAPNGLRACSPL